MIIKCKMCGGDIEFTPGSTYGTCEYCGSTSTIPKAEDEGKLNLFNRANHFRRQNEFDKALTAYERLLEQDDTDAEAHWGAVISRFGIEYVEDPATKKRIPTCHRVQLTSILADEDYKAAVQYAPDAESRRLYEEEAARIAEIQKGILAISQNEKPYDVFICYKETDEQGRRTHDSQWAQDVYYGLTEQGYKVFFSRITLEDKLGQEYEPYIFAALQSAKVMVVIGSKPEYFNAVWVKNEWSRYLALMAHDRKRLLIPCYRGMDPYDLPDELSSLQSQDMSKIGFMQDLIRGIRKVLDVDKKTDQPRVVQRVTQTTAADAAAPGVTSLMQRACLFLEDGDFSSAAEYLDRVLDIDPKFAPAYAAKVCVSFGFRKEADLAETTFQYEDNPDWQKALRFADAQQMAVYEGYAAKVKERVTRQIRDYAYDCAMEMAVLPGADRGKLDAELAAYKASCTRSTEKRADGSRRADSRMREDAFNQAVKANEPGDVSESGLKAAAAMFTAIGDSEAAERARQCETLAEQAQQKAIYQSAAEMRYREQHHPSGLEEAARLYLTVPDYKDAKAKAQVCIDIAESIRSGLYDSAVSAMNTAGGESGKWDAAKKKLAVDELDGYRDVAQLRAKAAKRYEECVAAEQEAKRQAEEKKRLEAEAVAAKKKRNTILSILAAIVVVSAVLVLTLVIIPGNNYRDAVVLQQAGRYEEAIAAFEALNGYSDSMTQIEACRTGIKERDYQAAVAHQQTGRYEEAITAFEALNGYSDSTTQIEACRTGIKERDYQAAVALQQTGRYEEAITAFEALNGYSDSTTQIEACRTGIKERDYQAAIALQQAGSYEEAINVFKALGSYSDTTAQIKETKYLQAKAMTVAGDYADAVYVFSGIKGYKDVDSLLANDHNLAEAVAVAARDAKYNVGNYVTFGHYPQTSGGNDSTEIEWLVLARDGSKALLISRYGLDAQPYNKYYVNITWEKCMLRTWLNGEFLSKAFTAEEQKGILLTNVDNGSKQGYWSTSGGNNTQDRVFLLSYAEANKYLGVTYNDGKNKKSRVAPTAYVIKQGAFTSSSNKTADGDASGWWWLRSPGYNQNYAADVSYDGSLYSSRVFDVSVCVRPALWINLECDIF